VIVLDASAAVELILASRPGAAVAQRLRRETLHAPAHFDIEVVGAVRRAVVRGLISDHEGLIAIGDFQSLSVRRWPTKPFIDRAYQLRTTHTVADAAYVALAEGLNTPLVTCDRRLAQSHGHRARIELAA
jgi:predicted nucleic acid-binding protein